MAPLPLIDHRPGRKTTWFELFFDLTFVIAMAGLTAAFAADYSYSGAGRFAFLFLVLWWLWLGQAFLYSRFDADRPDQRALGLVQMAAVVVIAHGAADPLGAGLWPFACGVALFKVVLGLGYLREAHRPGLGPLCRRFAILYATQSVLWALSPLAGDEAAPLVWALSLGIDLITPFVMARDTPRAPPHPEHLPERFGLFTLIVLGESAVAAVHVLDHGGGDAHTYTLALLGLGLGFLFWLGYFGRARGGQAREVTDNRFRLWAYGHLPLLLGLASLGAGIRALAGPMGDTPTAVSLFALGLTSAMLGVSIDSAVRAVAPWRHAAPHLVLAGLVLAATLAPVGSLSLLALSVVLAAAQVSLSLVNKRDDESF